MVNFDITFTASISRTQRLTHNNITTNAKSTSKISSLPLIRWIIFVCLMLVPSTIGLHEGDAQPPNGSAESVPIKYGAIGINPY
jgi:hypothetical protein